MKKVLSFVLCLCMLTSLFMPAFATEEGADALLPAAEPVIEEIPALAEIPTEEEIPAEETPTEDVSLEEETPAEEAPVEEIPAEEVPAEETPVEDVPAEEAPVEEVPVSDGATSGSCGTNVTWNIEDGVLTLSGSGAVTTYYRIGKIPFYSEADNITSVVIGKKITSIPMDTFYYCDNLTSITVESGSSSFSSVDGVLFSADKKTLISYPPAKEDTDYTIPDSVTMIASFAFYNADMATLDIPHGVKTVGQAAFSQCKNLTSLVLPDSVTTLSDDDGGSIVYNCTSLTSVTLPSGLTAIGDSLLSGATALKTVIIPEGVTTISESAFHKCKSLESIILPEGVTSIGARAFESCISLTSISIPEGVKTLPYFSFGDCEKLSRITLPKSLTTIGASAFHDCSALEDVYYPGTQSDWLEITIGDDNNHLKNANIHYSIAPAIAGGSVNSAVRWSLDTSGILTVAVDGYKLPDFSGDNPPPWYPYRKSIVTVIIDNDQYDAEYLDIGEYAFADCTNLTLVTLTRNNLMDVADTAFAGCTKLKNVPKNAPTSGTLPSPTGNSSSGTVSLFSWDYDETTKTLTISGTGAMPDYEKPDDAPWCGYRNECTAIVIENGVTAIGTYAFREFAITELTVPGSVTTIGQGAFSQCAALAEVTLSEGVKTLKGESFANCNGLKTVHLPSTLLDYGNSEFFAFAGCNAIEDVYYNGMETQFTMNLGRSYFPETTEIHYTAPAFPLSGKVNDTITWELTEDYTLTLTGTGAMPDYEHSSKTPWAGYRFDVKKIVIGEGITHAGGYAFEYCSKVTEVTLPSTLESIGESAFASGGAGGSLTLPENLKTIGKNAFWMNSLTTVTIPAGVTEIGQTALGGAGLESVRVLGNPTYEYGAFNNNNITSLSLAAGPKTLPECFEWLSFLKNLTLTEPFETLDGDFIAKNEDLETITMTAGENRRFLAWKDEDGAILSCADIVGGAAFTGDLTALWGDIHPGDAPIPDSMTYWNVKDGVLTISGIGPMPDYTAPTDAPWAQHLENITAVVIEDGVTYVGDYTFDLCYNIGAVSLPKSLTGIGSAAFRGCGLEAVHIPKPCTLADDAFDDNPIEILSLGEGHTVIPECFSDVTTLTDLNLCYPFEMLEGDFIAQNEDLERIIVAPEAYEGIELVEWMDEELNTYFPDDLLMTDLSGKTLHAVYQYIWLDPGPFEDVDEDDWFYDYVKYCYQEGIMKGISESLFDPASSASRAEVVTVLYRMAGEPEVTAAASFTDVPADEWFSNAVAWAASEGIAKGYGNGKFEPYAYVTREEFLVFLNRFAGYMELNLNTWSQHYHLRNFADYQYISDWAMEAEVWSVFMGLQTGVQEGDKTYLYPQEHILRSELATFLCRFMDNILSIAQLELIQSCVGRDGDYVISIFGEPKIYSKNGQDVRFECPLAATNPPRCDEYVKGSSNSCITKRWDYDGLAFFVHTDKAGNDVVLLWTTLE